MIQKIADEKIQVPLSIRFRLCEEKDLPALEWYGVFFQHRKIIRSTFMKQQEGKACMVLAVTDQAPIGQVWIDFEQKRRSSIGVIWALRVMPGLQRLGIGTRLLEISERILARNQFRFAELGVEKTESSSIRHFYESRGYHLTGSDDAEIPLEDSSGWVFLIPVDQWILRKDLEERKEAAWQKSGFVGLSELSAPMDSRP